VDVGEIQRVQELAIGPIARMRDQVDLGEARGLDVPAVRLQRNVMFEQRAGAGPAVLALAQLLLERLQYPVHLPRAHGSQFRRDVGGQRPPADRPRQPDRQ
jgi:hypothetical protein